MKLNVDLTPMVSDVIANETDFTETTKIPLIVLTRITSAGPGGGSKNFDNWV